MNANLCLRWRTFSHYPRLVPWGRGNTWGRDGLFAILHIALNTSIQDNLQAELDRIVGRDQFPFVQSQEQVINHWRIQGACLR